MADETANGYRVVFGKDVVDVVPYDGDCVVEIGDITLSLEGSTVSLTPREAVARVSIEAVRIERLEKMTDEPVFGEGKKCIICDGKRYCAKNGCIKTPCGWLCG